MWQSSCFPNKFQSLSKAFLHFFSSLLPPPPPDLCPSLQQMALPHIPLGEQKPKEGNVFVPLPLHLEPLRSCASVSRLSCQHKMPHPEWLHQQDVFTVPEAQSPRSKCHWGWFLLYNQCPSLPRVILASIQRCPSLTPQSSSISLQNSSLKHYINHCLRLNFFHSSDRSNLLASKAPQHLNMFQIQWVFLILLKYSATFHPGHHTHP